MFYILILIAFSMRTAKGGPYELVILRRFVYRRIMFIILKRNYVVMFFRGRSHLQSA